jgi:hypothetical protein
MERKVTRKFQFKLLKLEQEILKTQAKKQPSEICFLSFIQVKELMSTRLPIGSLKGVFKKT